MSDDPLVLLVIGFLLTGVLGTALGYVFQQRAWRHQYRQQREDLLRDQALKTFEEISTLLDRRLYRMRRVAWEAKRRARKDTGGAGLSTAVDDYRSTVQLWNDNLNRILALVDTYFGTGARRHLEDGLYETYRAIGEELDEFVREVSARGQDPVRVRPVGARLTQLSRQVYDFNVVLLRLLRDGRLGARAPEAPAVPVPAERVLVRFGDVGDDVRRVQRALHGAGDDVAVDGIFGRDTERTLRQFQLSAGLRADGIAGPDTRRALGLAHLEAADG